MTRQRLRAGRAAVAEDGGQETTAQTSYRQRLFVEHDLGESSGSTIDVALSWVSEVVSFKTNVSPLLDGRAVGKSRL